MPLPKKIITLKTNAVVFEFDGARGGLRRLAAERKFEYVCPGGLGNWRLILAKGKEERACGPEHLPAFTCAPSGAGFTGSWGAPTFPGLPAHFKVSVTWQLAGDLLAGRLSYQGLDSDWRVKWIYFPHVAFREKAHADLVVPAGFGLLIRNAGKTVFRNPAVHRQYRCQYLNNGTMQFCAYLAGNEGLYFDTRDPLGYVKHMCFAKGEQDTVVYTARHLMPQNPEPQRHYRMPYRVSCGVFQGDWFAAARLYRPWALRQAWASQSLARRKSRTGRRVSRIALWIWNRGSIRNAVRPVERLARQLGLPVALDWYWWHRNPYDSEYPRYLPPREGVPRFKAAIARLKRLGIFAQVYINGMLWDADDKSFEQGGRQSATMNENGKARQFAFNVFLGHPLAFMCGSARRFHRTIESLAGAIRQFGVEGLYLDCIATTSGQPCYSPDHGHPLGGGHYQVAGYRRLLKSLRRKYPRLVLSSESCGEVYLDLLDTGILLDPSLERFYRMTDREVIPLFNAVYHGTFPLFGNYALADGIPPYDPLWPATGKWKREVNGQALCPDQFFVEIARCLVWGLQPTVANLRLEHLDTPAFAAEREFLCEAVRTFYANRDFLLDGAMLAPGRLSVKPVAVRFLKRFIFTPEGRHEIVRQRLPGILHSRWRAEDGREALVLANPTRQALAFCYRQAGRRLAGTLAPRSFQLLPG